jgi:hypothetical protein
MKTKLATFLICISQLIAAVEINAYELLNEGEFYNFSFFTPNSTQETFDFDIRVGIKFSEIDLLDNGESYEFSLFENADSLAPFDSSTYSGSPRSSTSGLTRTISNASGTSPWQADLNGLIRLEMISGSIALESIEIAITDINGNFYEQIYIVPEPAQYSLLIGLMTAFAITCKRRSFSEKS